MILKQEEIFARIRKSMGFKQEKELSNFFEIAPQSLSTVKKRGTIPFQKIIEKCLGNYNLEYIFFGSGREKPPKFDLNGNYEKSIQYNELYETVKVLENKIKKIEKEINKENKE